MGPRSAAARLGLLLVLLQDLPVDFVALRAREGSHGAAVGDRNSLVRYKRRRRRRVCWVLHCRRPAGGRDALRARARGRKAGARLLPQILNACARRGRRSRGVHTGARWRQREQRRRPARGATAAAAAHISPARCCGSRASPTCPRSPSMRNDAHSPSGSLLLLLRCRRRRRRARCSSSSLCTDARARRTTRGRGRGGAVPAAKAVDLTRPPRTRCRGAHPGGRGSHATVLSRHELLAAGRLGCSRAPLPTYICYTP